MVRIRIRIKTLRIRTRALLISTYRYCPIPFSWALLGLKPVPYLTRHWLLQPCISMSFTVIFFRNMYPIIQTVQTVSFIMTMRTYVDSPFKEKLFLTNLSLLLINLARQWYCNTNTSEPIETVKILHVIWIYVDSPRPRGNYS